jgi:hypothetical protein
MRTTENVGQGEVDLVCFVHLVGLVQRNKPNRPINKRNHPGLARLA